MGQSVWGSAGPIETYADSASDPMQGWDQEIRYRGFPDDLVTLVEGFIAAGWQARTETNNSPWSTLIVKIPNNTDADYLDRWEFNIDFRQQELLTNIGICNTLIALEYPASSLPSMALKLQGYIDNKDTEDTVQAAFSSYPDGGVGALAIFQMMEAGQMYVEVGQPTISRKRTYSNSFSGAAMTTRMVQTVYSTSALISTFGIPTSVSDQISADPDATGVPNYQFGWKMRRNNLVIVPAKNKIEEQIDFVWDQWNLMAYYYVPLAAHLAGKRINRAGFVDVSPDRGPGCRLGFRSRPIRRCRHNISLHGTDSIPEKGVPILIRIARRGKYRRCKFDDGKPRHLLFDGLRRVLLSQPEKLGLARPGH